MDNEQENAAESANAGVSRGQNQLHFVPEDWQAASAVIRPLVDRLDDASPTTQMIVLANDVDAVAGIGSRLGAGLGEERPLRLVTATHSRRSVRVLRRAPAQILVATPEVLAELLQSATVKLDDVKVAVLAWLDDLDVKGTQSLEAVMTEVPKDAARIIVASRTETGVEALVERYARRARRVQGTVAEAEPVSISYIAVGDVARPMALRRILDALDPESAFVVTTTRDSNREVEAQLRSLGYGGDASDVRFGERPDATAQLVVLYDFPISAEQLRATLAPAPSARVVVLAAPRQLATLRRWAGAGGSVTPLMLPDAALRARTREDAIREEIRETLLAGGFSRELIALEPLLTEHDGVEVAAALLRLLELERTRPQTPASAAAAAAAMTRVFVNVGEMDGVRAGDLIGAITNEAGISKAEIGRVEIRERHSTVEVATAVANTVVSKLTGVTIRGRRALVKIDEGRERRDSQGSRERGGSRGGAQRRDRGSRPSRPPRPPSRTR